MDKKRILWKKIQDSKCKIPGGFWCITGDFNGFKSEAERKGRGNVAHLREMREFGMFIQNMKLGGVTKEGNKFMWYSFDGKSMIRLDTFFLYEELISKWNISCQHVGLKDVSDHAPV